MRRSGHACDTQICSVLVPVQTAHVDYGTERASQVRDGTAVDPLHDIFLAPKSLLCFGQYCKKFLLADYRNLKY